MQQRKPLDSTAAGLMILLCAIWGLQQIAVKAAGSDMAPILQISIRSGIAAVLVGFFLHMRGEGLIPKNGAWKPGIAAGFLFALEYLLVGEGLRFTSASHMVVFLYTAPGFAALGLHVLLPEERLKPLQWGGMLLAFSGIAVAFYENAPDGSGFDSSMLFGDLLGLLAGIAWGATTIVIRCTKLAETPSTQTVLCQLSGAFILLLIASIWLGQTSFTMTPVVWGSLVFQTIIVSFVSFLIWFWLLRNYLASRLGVLCFLTPPFGIAFGVILLDEQVETRFLIGSCMIIAGIIIVSGYTWIANLLARNT